MKTKYKLDFLKSLSFCVITALVISSCSSYHAVSKKTDSLEYETVRVYPEWKYKDSKGKKGISIAVGLSAGAAYGYSTNTKVGDEVYTGSSNAALWGLGGACVSAIINQVLFPKKKRSRTKFQPNESDKWLESYNKTSSSFYYLHKKESNSTLVLIPKARIESIRVNYGALLVDLESDEPKTTFVEVQVWRTKLGGEYSILPASEITLVRDALSKNEKRIAGSELMIKVSSLPNLKNDYSSLDQIISFNNKNRGVYNASDKNSQINSDEIVEQKLNEVLGEILPVEHQSIESIGDAKDDINEVNAFHKSFNDRFRSLSKNNLIQEIHSKIETKIVQLIELNVGSISYDIKSANSIRELRGLTSLYLSKISEEELIVVDLNNKIETQWNSILEKERLDEIANKEKKRKENSNFVIDNLNKEWLLTLFFRGEFESIPFDRDEMEFSILFNTYIMTFAKYCDASLPFNKMELTEEVCEAEMVTTNGWGIETSRYCSRWRTQGLGLYASPEMHRAKTIVDNLYSGNAIGDAFKILLQENYIGEFQRLSNFGNEIEADIINLLVTKGCDHEGLLRFQENLLLFALHKKPIRIGGDVVTNSSNIKVGNQNMNNLVDELIYANSRKWKMNRYQKNNVSNVKVASKDAQGRAEEVSASYQYQGFNGQSSGTVRVVFQEGLPECLYFFDYPYTCKTADRKVVAGFAKGDFQK